MLWADWIYLEAAPTREALEVLRRLEDEIGNTGPLNAEEVRRLCKALAVRRLRSVSGNHNEDEHEDMLQEDMRIVLTRARHAPALVELVKETWWTRRLDAVCAPGMLLALTALITTFAIWATLSFVAKLTDQTVGKLLLDSHAGSTVLACILVNGFAGFAAYILVRELHGRALRVRTEMRMLALTALDRTYFADADERRTIRLELRMHLQQDEGRQ